MVIIAVVAFDFGDDSQIVKVVDGFAKGVVGWCGASE
jgi:hypothetical protein